MESVGKCGVEACQPKSHPNFGANVHIALDTLEHTKQKQSGPSENKTADNIIYRVVGLDSSLFNDTVVLLITTILPGSSFALWLVRLLVATVLQCAPSP